MKAAGRPGFFASRGLLLGLIALAFGASGALTRPAAVPGVGAPVASPAVLAVRTPTRLVVTSQITDPTVVAGGVKLHVVNTSGVSIGIVGVMHDDGQGDDTVAGDGVFTVGVNLNKAAPGELYLRVSAAFQGLLKPVLSPITLLPISTRPVASAGPDQNALVGTPLVLDGTASHDPGGAVVAFHWTLVQAPAGSAATLGQPAHPAPAFVPDVAGAYAFDLTVQNSLLASAPDRVNVTAFSAAAPPNARAGRDQTVRAGTAVTLDGSDSFHPDGGPLQFHWSVALRPAWSRVTDASISGAAGAVAGFTPDVAGTYRLALTVTAGSLSATDTVDVKALATKVPPVANAGPDQATSVSPIVLDGSASVDPDGGPSPLAFSWSLVTRPAGSARTSADILGAAAPAASFMPDVPGAYLFHLRVSDGIAADEDGVLVLFGANRPPIALPDTATTPQGIPVTLDVLANDSDPDGQPLVVSGVSVPASGTAVVTAGGVAYTPAPGFVGTDGFVYSVSDGAGGSASAGVTITVTNVNDAPAVTLTATPLSGTAPLDVTFTATASDPDGDALTYTWDFGDGTTITGMATESHTYAGAGTFTATVTVSDGLLGAAASATIVVTEAAPPDPTLPPVPPDPTPGATPLPTGTATDIRAATEFLYSGPNAIQTGVTPGTIDARMVTVVRGRVLTRDGAPLPAVTITVLGKPEFGQTVSRADGAFDLALNGGGLVTLVYARPGYLTAQRSVNAPWRDYAVAPDVALVALDTRATTVAGAAPVVQVTRGNPVTDIAGTRQSTLLFMPGTSAAMTLPDGTVQPLGALTVRATEFTVGPNGRAAMPGLLPASSGYTYAVELSADEALAAGATQVTFSQPVFNYVENFLGFPVGGIVPTGYYDRQRAAWVASDNGRVIGVVSITAGLADLDTDGDGVADGGLGITDAERQTLATLYGPGRSLWRVPIPHFTPWDHNWPFGPPPNATAPNQPIPAPPAVDDGCDWTSSIIQCHNQTLAEELPVTGTPYRLRYQSDRVPGRREAYTLTIPLSGASVPDTLRRIDFEVQVAGRRFAGTRAGAPSQSVVFTWDGRDAFGRTVQGAATLYVRIGYVYGGVYQPPSISVQAFAQISGSAGSGSGNIARIVVGDLAREEITIWQDYTTSIGAWDARAAGLGGWDLHVHHAYDPNSRVVHLGDGGRRSTQSASEVIEAFVGPNTGRGFLGDGGPALSARLADPRGVAVGPDGSVYIADSGNHRIRRVGPDGIITTFAGSGATCPNIDTCIGTFSGDGGPATAATLNQPQAVAVAPDGSVYIADGNNARLRRVTPDGIIRTVAGTGVRGFSGDGGPALLAQVSFIRGVAVGPDGAVYFSDAHFDVLIRRIDPSGIITTVAGGGTLIAADADGGPATGARFFVASNLAVGPDGSIYMGDGPGVRKISPDGVIRTLVGGGSTGGRLDVILGDVAIGPGGAIYVRRCCSGGQSARIERVNPDGTTTLVAGGLVLVTDIRFIGSGGDGGRATQSDLVFPTSLAVGPDGTLYFSNSIGQSFFGQGAHRVRRIRPAFPAFAVGEIAVASATGTEVWVFGADGRHLRTHETLTGAVRRQFAYDVAGRLLSVTDVAGNVTTIERGAGGAPLAIVAPGGQRTALAVDGADFLTAVTNPAAATVGLTHTPDGLLTMLRRAGGGVSRFAYDAGGRLVRDETADGNVLTFTRTETATGFSVEQRSTLGRTITYALERLPDGAVRQRNTDPSGRVTEAVTDVRGAQTGTFPDGTVMTLTTRADSRFGSQVSVLDRLVVTLPSGITSTTTRTRSVTVPTPGALLNPTILDDGTTVNGRFRSSRWVASTRTITTTSPAGRQSVVTLDGLGRIVRLAAGAGLAPVLWTYDGLGRVGQMTQGNQSWTFTYDAQHRPVTRTDALGGQVRFEYDGADRITQIRYPSGNAVGFTYDADGNRTAVIMPSGAVHALGFTAAGRDAAYAPPGVAASTRAYDADGAPALTTLASGQVLQSFYDAGGRVIGQTFPGVALDYAYDPVVPSSGVSRLTRTPTTGTAQDIVLTYDGPLPRTALFSGAAAGQYTYGYDANLFLVSMNLLSAGDSVPLAVTYDADGLPTGYGPFTIARAGPGGAASQMTDGTGTLAFGWDASGRQIERTLTVAGAQVLRTQIEYDPAGRLTRKTETAGGVATVFEYGYDGDGQLLETRRDGTLVEQYAYDVNNNRTSRRLPDGSVESAAYDTADRLVQRGGLSIDHDADGFVTARGPDASVYDARGALTATTVGGQTTTYAYDAIGRRVSRTDAAGTTRYLYGNPGNVMQVTAVREPDGRLTALYYDGHGYLIALERGGARFYVATDHLGTPRMVVNAAGAVVKSLEYDSFGVPLADSDPSFALALGFAGGLADPHAGLVRFGFRDYEPAAGRWMARDPALYSGGQANLYAYVGNGPVANRDPLGLWCFGFSGFAIVGGGGQVCTTGNDLAVCGEIGFGAGGGASISDGMPTNGTTFGAEIGAECGPLGVGAAITLDSCGDLKVGPTVKMGPLSVAPVSVTPGAVSATHSPSNNNQSAGNQGPGAPPPGPADPGGGAGKCKIGGKLTGGGCYNLL